MRRPARRPWVRPFLALSLWIACALPPAAHAGSSHVDYMLQCQGCHLPDGSGKPGAVPSLRNCVGRYLTVPGGRDYLVRVPGSSQSPLTDAELAGVLNWMIERFGPDEVAQSFVPYSAKEIERVRRPPLTDVDGLRRELLARLSGAGCE